MTEPKPFAIHIFPPSDVIIGGAYVVVMLRGRAISSRSGDFDYAHAIDCAREEMRYSPTTGECTSEIFDHWKG